MITSSAFTQLGKGTSPDRGWHTVVPDDISKKLLDLRVPAANRPMVWGRDTVVVA
jgi:hypothetical protein